MILFSFFCLLCFCDITDLWKQAGCTDDGLLSPSNSNSFWKRRSNEIATIKTISKGVKERDSLSLLTCQGSQSLNLDSINRGQDITIHLLWECYDKTDSCNIPFVHTLCVQTLRTTHPHAHIILWSNTVDDVQDDLFELRRYDWETLFSDLPQNALNAARTMQSFFPIHQNSRSHFSDLFRAVVLYKFGGYYSDLDSIWLRDIESISDSKNWIPITPSWQELDDEDQIRIDGEAFFLEGGIMKFEKGSPFLKEVLERFPEYTEEVVSCWECVGPRLLTQTYNRMQDSNPEALPEFIDSQRVYGVPHYRNYFPNMFKEFDPDIWFEFVESGTVAAHLFTSSVQPGIEPSSILSSLFSVGGVSELSTEKSASWRESISERRNLLSSLYYINEDNIGSAQIGGGSVIYWVGELPPVEAIVILNEVNDANIEILRTIFYEAYPPVVLSSVVVEQIDSTTVRVTVNEPDYYSVTAQSVQVGIDLQLNALQAAITDMTIPEIGGARASLTAECISGTALESASSLETISSSMANHVGIDVEDLDMSTTFATSAGAFCIFSSELTDAEKASTVKAGLVSALEVTEDDVTVQEPNAIGNLLFSVSTSNFADADAVNDLLRSSPTEATVNAGLSDGDTCQILTGTDNMVSTTDVIAATTGTTSTALESAVALAQADIEAAGCTVLSTDARVYGAQAVESCDLLGECTADYQEMIDDINADMGLVKGSEVIDLNPWWVARLEENLVPNHDQVKLYNGFFVVPCDSCTDENMYVNTCVQFSENMQDECDTSIGWCAGDPVAVYGWAGQQSSALIAALEMPQKQHPYCPWGCQKLNDWWLGELDARLSDENKAHLDTICVQDGKYYLYSDPQTKSDTCVGYNDLHSTLCPLSSYVFCSSTDNGMVTYGWVGQQARALNQALSTSLNRHPSCK